MSWTGRKRGAGDRFPSGKLKPRKPPKPPEQPHRKGYGSHPLAETVHGRYLLDGLITPQQHTAGELFRQARVRYQIAIGSPASLRNRSEGYPDNLGERDDARDIADFEAARTALGRLTVDVEWVCCQDAMLSDLTAYRAGLDVLRRIYRV
jgi:hypothetical protein